MPTTILVTAKAWSALIGAIATALLGAFAPDDPIYRALTIVVAVATAITVYVVPNQTTTPPVE